MIPWVVGFACTGPVGKDTGPSCEDAETVTWDNFGKGFLTENCQTCHASTAEGYDRNGAPEEVTFDTKDQAWTWASRILIMATGENPLMPPEGGVGDDARLQLFWWLGCGEEGS
jgi:uncharacterized membrane protein